MECCCWCRVVESGREVPSLYIAALERDVDCPALEIPCRVGIPSCPRSDATPEHAVARCVGGTAAVSGPFNNAHAAEDRSHLPQAPNKPCPIRACPRNIMITPHPRSAVDSLRGILAFPFVAVESSRV